jgi:hypothetical protein
LIAVKASWQVCDMIVSNWQNITLSQLAEWCILWQSIEPWEGSKQSKSLYCQGTMQGEFL